jgi:septal ring factor EnvC (AmiA/AmiB activator)
VAVASIATVALLARRPAPPVARTEMTPHLQQVEHDLARVSAEQRARAERIELAAIERDLDAMTDRLEVAAEAVAEATSDRERTDAKVRLANLEHEIHDRAQREQDRSDELRSRLGD